MRPGRDRATDGRRRGADGSIATSEYLGRQFSWLLLLVVVLPDAVGYLLWAATQPAAVRSEWAAAPRDWLAVLADAGSVVHATGRLRHCKTVLLAGAVVEYQHGHYQS